MRPRDCGRSPLPRPEGVPLALLLRAGGAVAAQGQRGEVLGRRGGQSCFGQFPAGASVLCYPWSAMLCTACCGCASSSGSSRSTSDRAQSVPRSSIACWPLGTLAGRGRLRRAPCRGGAGLPRWGVPHAALAACVGQQRQQPCSLRAQQRTSVLVRGARGPEPAAQLLAGLRGRSGLLLCAANLQIPATDVRARLRE